MVLMHNNHTPHVLKELMHNRKKHNRNNSIPTNLMVSEVKFKCLHSTSQHLVPTRDAVKSFTGLYGSFTDPTLVAPSLLVATTG